MVEQKEFHFFYNIEDIEPFDSYAADWKETEEYFQIKYPIIRTGQMGWLIFSNRIFDAGYRIFIHDEQGAFEITMGDCARTNREIRPSHNLFKMWISGEFTNYEKEN